MASKNICCNSPRAIMLIYTYVQLWISRAIFSVLIILFTAALNLKISQECKSEWKRKKEKKNQKLERFVVMKYLWFAPFKIAKPPQ